MYLQKIIVTPIPISKCKFQLPLCSTTSSVAQPQSSDSVLEIGCFLWMKCEPKASSARFIARLYEAVLKAIIEADCDIRLLELSL
jgi:hypothetical protein